METTTLALVNDGQSKLTNPNIYYTWSFKIYGSKLMVSIVVLPSSPWSDLGNIISDEYVSHVLNMKLLQHKFT